MSQDLGTPAPSNPVASLSWSDVWIKALTRPSVATYEEFARDPKATAGRAYLWIVISALIGTVIQAMAYVAFGAGSAFLGPLVFSTVCYGVVGSVLVFLLISGITHGIARALGGVGTYSQLAFAFAAYLAPLELVGIVLSFIPILNCLAFVISIYGIVLNVIAVKAVHQFGWGRAIVSSVVIVVGLLLLASIVVIVILALMGPAIGNIYSNIYINI